jgi:mannobiose 2-epimerase
MNTMLHVMEGFANLLRVWEDALLRARLRECIQFFLERIIDPADAHLRLFFDDAWNSLAQGASYGHDIEGAWLLLEAAEVLGEPGLIDTVRKVSQSMAQAVLDHGLWPDGSVIYEQTGGSHRSQERQWWTVAEGMVGLYNAYQLSGKPAFGEAAFGCWKFAERSLVDREHGDWFKILDGECKPVKESPKIGPWECPYHHSRACMEMIRRLEEP